MTATRKLKKKKAEKKLKLCQNNALQNLIRNTFLSLSFHEILLIKSPYSRKSQTIPFYSFSFFYALFDF